MCGGGGGGGVIEGVLLPINATVFLSEELAGATLKQCARHITAHNV